MPPLGQGSQYYEPSEAGAALGLLGSLRSQAAGVPAALLGLMLVSAQLLPSFVMYVRLGASMALGTAVCAAIILVAALFNDAAASAGGRRLYNSKVLLVPLFLAAAITIHVVVADLVEPINAFRFAASMPLFVLVCASAILLGLSMAFSRSETLDRVLRISLSLLCLVILLKVLGLQPRTDLGKSFFPFTETSHFGLTFGPVFIYFCMRAPTRRRYWILLLGTALALGVQSMVLVVVVAVAAIVSRKTRFLLAGALIATAGIAILIGLPSGASYYIDRVNFFSGTVLNLSNLVYIQGWEQLLGSLASSHGWGLGFQQFGVHGSDAAVTPIIEAIMSGNDLNLMDGSFVFAKLGGELGLFGILLTMMFLRLAIRSVRALRNDESDRVLIFAHCVIVCYFIDMFVRGVGYFAGSSLLFVAAVTTLATRRKAAQLVSAPASNLPLAALVGRE